MAPGIAAAGAGADGHGIPFPGGPFPEISQRGITVAAQDDCQGPAVQSGDIMAAAPSWGRLPCPGQRVEIVWHLWGLGPGPTCTPPGRWRLARRGYDATRQMNCLLHEAYARALHAPGQSNIHSFVRTTIAQELNR